MRLKHLFLLFVLYCCANGSPTTTTEKLEILTAESVNLQENENAENPQEEAEIPMKTFTDLVRQQTEAIKKIVSEQQSLPKTIVEDNNLKSKEALENDSIEELKKKCLHLSKISNFGDPHQPQKLQDETTERPRTVEGFGPYMQPELLRFKPKFPPPPSINMPQPPQMSGNYFIFTQNPEMYQHRINKFSDKMDAVASGVEEDIAAPPTDGDYEDEETLTTTTPQSESEPEPAQVETEAPATQPPATTPKAVKLKYVRLEPIVLKKVLLPTGKTSLYWYRLLPNTQSFVQMPDTPEMEDVKVVAQPQAINNGVLLPSQYQFYVDPQSGAIRKNSPIKQQVDVAMTATTERPIAITTAPPAPRPQFFFNPQTGMIYQSALPHQFTYHKRVTDSPPPQEQPQPPPTTTTTTTTTEKIPLPSYTIDMPQPEEQSSAGESKPQFKHEFRFVIPMLVTGTQDGVSNFPNQLDPYAYLPKDQRPATMNIPVPYVPTYQMIRTLTIPQKFQELASKKER